MLVSANRLIGTPILSMQSASSIGTIANPIVDPDTFKIIAFYLDSPLAGKDTNILDTKSIREYSRYGCVIDSIEELIGKDDVVKISKVIELNFDLIGLKVETKKGSHLGKVIDFTVTSEDFTIQQIIVKRPLIKSFSDPELTIPRKEIVEVTDYKIIVKDEEKVIKKKAAHEDFIPNFVNPFRTQGQDLAPTRTKTPAEQDTE
ncbi:PRC-barrel domain-containing protein [Candidatus Saccharibacteria bacterium]|nr:PRC-barrel domain-containing protein [Candidatus Saccharibacteria bacterium]MBQ1540122.1 PRC-barrel domain-containing protein [Candidatus Saccharibacteria bacterium]